VQTLPEQIVALTTTHWLQKSALDCRVRGRNTSSLCCEKEWTWYNILFENISWYPRPVCVGFVEERVALGQGFLLAVQFYPNQYRSTTAPCSFIHNRLCTISANCSVVK